eukprot:TRINITY_DN24797_c0_g1_i1.p2 TRINITY_DN24797_c0_g1~~TRINITY_DN24797_c0_g1_i1.p2  ORF type:complete len:200 (+),score=31.09 TRINITY_DN24797_c0_g1_i1:69-668(+)
MGGSHGCLGWVFRPAGAYEAVRGEAAAVDTAVCSSQTSPTPRRSQPADACVQVSEHDISGDTCSVIPYIPPSRFGLRVGAPVLLVVYDLPDMGGLSKIAPLVGLPLHHSGVAVPSWGREYAYGSGAAGRTGVYWTQPTRSAPHFREFLLLGSLKGGQRQGEKIVEALAEEWPASEYNILRRNCNHFSSALAKALVGPDT